MSLSPTETRESKKGWVLKALLKLLGVPELLPRARPSGALLQWIQMWRPQLLYVQPVTSQAIALANGICTRTMIPLAIHPMDDWHPVAFGPGPLGWYFRRNLDAEFKKLAHRASIRLGICQAMCDEYEARYDGKWFPFHNPVDLSSFRKVARCDWLAGKPFKVRYGGRTDWGIRQSVVDMARSIADLRKTGLNIVFEIHTTHSGDPALAELRSLDGSVLLPLETYESLAQSLASSDLLVIVYDWTAKSRAFNRLSMPTKAAECMASGTPILLYGPAGHAVIEYARKEKWGHVVSECDPATLQAALRELVTNQLLRECLGSSGIEMAARNHESQKIRSQFRELLASKVESSLSD